MCIEDLTEESIVSSDQLPPGDWVAQVHWISGSITMLRTIFGIESNLPLFALSIVLDFDLFVFMYHNI